MVNLNINSDWTPYSEYHIDFARGIVTHSKAASRGQRNRIFKSIEVGGSLKHLSYFQTTDFYKKNKTAEMYLIYLRQM
jgi:hypothetical protein